MEHKQWLPPDLFPEILSKLPFKSLLRFRSVSKTWRSIIHDPKFLKARKNRPKSQILVIRQEQGAIESAIRCSKTFQVIAEHRFPSELRMRYREVFGCNEGLLVFDFLQGNQNELFLWNPSIRRVQKLPQTPEFESSKSISMGIGFDGSIEDYKLVRIGIESYCRSEKDHVLVYTLGTDSWKTIPFKTKGRMPFSFHRVHNEGGGVCFRGVLYSIARTPYPHQNIKKQRMVSFDLSIEEFSYSELPELDHDGILVLKCPSDNSRLAFLFTSEDEGSIWWAQGERDDVTWSKHYKFCLNFPVSDGNWWNVMDVLNIDVNPSRKDENGGENEVSVELKLLRSQSVVISYNVQSHEKKILLELQKTPSYHLEISQVYAFPYIESLVLLKK